MQNDYLNNNYRSHGDRWKFEPDRDKLTPEEREAIFKLPQS